MIQLSFIGEVRVKLSGNAAAWHAMRQFGLFQQVRMRRLRHSYDQSDIADEPCVKRSTGPLFQFDPGWLFIAAGLTVCAAGIILPAQEDLQTLRLQLEQLRGEEIHAYARLKAHSDFMDQVDRADPSLVRRLAAAQLNLVPAGDTPLLLTASATSPVTDWIDATVNPDIRPPKPAPISTLGRLANGPYRLWMFGGGIMAVFVGLILSPTPVRVWPARSRNDGETSDAADWTHDEGHSRATDVIEIPAVSVEIKSGYAVEDEEVLRPNNGDASDDGVAISSAIEAKFEPTLEAADCDASEEQPQTIAIGEDDPLVADADDLGGLTESRESMEECEPYALDEEDQDRDWAPSS
jgi:hypothetical protein